MIKDFISLNSEAIESYFAFNEAIGAGDIISLKPYKKLKVEKLVEPKRQTTLPINLVELNEEIKRFNGCNLKRFATNTVVGEGAKDSEILIIGEAPGEEEDINGIPFCGRSGKLLERALNRFGLFRDKNFYITNSVFWRPPGNRKPEEEELASCRTFLERMIKIIRPKIIICVGSVSISNAINTKESISSLRKKEFLFKFLHEPQEDFKVITLYHPSYLLRNPAKKRDMYLDLLWFYKSYKNQLTAFNN